MRQLLNMARTGPAYIGLIYAVTLWKHVMSQCSEAHNTACSWPLVHLRQYDGLFSPLGGFMPDYNETTLTEVCGFFNTYMDCSEPFLNHCNNNTILQLHEIQSAFTSLCTHSKAYVTHRTCYIGLEPRYNDCHQKRQNSMKTIRSDSISETQYRNSLCDLTNRYVQCIFTVTAIGCSIEAADLYYTIINQSVTSLLKDIKNFTCIIRHPDDVIKVLTTTTTTTTTTIPEQTFRSTKPTVSAQSTSGNSQHISSAHRNSSHSILLTFLVILFTNYICR